MQQNSLSRHFTISNLSLLLTVVAMSVSLVISGMMALQDDSAASDSYTRLIETLPVDNIALTPAAEIKQPFLSVSGRLMKVGDIEVQVFAYGDEKLAKEEVSRISSDGYVVEDSPILWNATPHFFYIQDVIAIYVGDDSAAIAQLVGMFGEPFAGHNRVDTPDNELA